MTPQASSQNFEPRTPRRSCVDVEEQHAWMDFYKQVGRDADLAAEVMAQLDADPDMKRRHLALYLRCKQSQRVHKARLARDRRIAHWLRLLMHRGLTGPVGYVCAAAPRAVRRCAAILAEALPTGHSPAPGRAERAARSLARPTAGPLAAFRQQAGMALASEPALQTGDEPRAPSVPVSRR